MRTSWLKRVDAHQFFSPFSGVNGTIRIPGSEFVKKHGLLVRLVFIFTLILIFVLILHFEINNYLRWLCRWVSFVQSAQKFDYYLFTFDTTYLIIDNIVKDLHDANTNSFYSMLNGVRAFN